MKKLLLTTLLLFISINSMAYDLVWKAYSENYINEEVGKETSLSVFLINNGDEKINKIHFTSIMKTKSIKFFHNCKSLEAYDSCLIKVKFKPTSVGKFYKALIVNTDKESAVADLKIYGEGLKQKTTKKREYQKRNLASTYNRQESSSQNYEDKEYVESPYNNESNESFLAEVPESVSVNDKEDQDDSNFINPVIVSDIIDAPVTTITNNDTQTNSGSNTINPVIVGNFPPVINSNNDNDNDNDNAGSTTNSNTNTTNNSTPTVTVVDNPSDENENTNDSNDSSSDSEDTNSNTDASSDDNTSPDTSTDTSDDNSDTNTDNDSESEDSNSNSDDQTDTVVDEPIVEDPAPIEVPKINQAPILENYIFNVEEDSTLNNNLNALDPEGDSLTWSISPNNLSSQEASFSLIDGVLNYTPKKNFSGVNSYTITVSDSTNSVSRELTINVTPVNDAPTANPETLVLETFKNEEVNAELVIRDIEEDSFTTKLLGNEANSFLIGSNFTYNPGLFVGEKLFTYEITDQNNAKTTSFIKVIVKDKNILPESDAGLSFNFLNTKNTDFNLPMRDLDSTNLTVEFLTSPTLGTISGNTNPLSFQPKNDSTVGTEEIQFRIFDSEGYSENYSFSLTVTQGNRAPVVADQEVILVNEDEFKNIDLTALDLDNDLLNYTVDIAPSNGLLNLDNMPIVKYNPNLNYNGLDEFKYTVSDGDFSIQKTVNIKVIPVDDEPIMENINLRTLEETPITYTLSATDIDSSNLVYTLLNPSSEVSLNANQFTYIPIENFNGIFTQEISISDGVNTLNRTITVTVDPVNDLPELLSKNFNTEEDQILIENLITKDVDGDSVSISIESTNNGATATLDGNQLSYSPGADFNGIDTVIVKLNDGTSEVTETITITVNSVNDEVKINDNIVSDIFVNESKEWTLSDYVSDKDGDDLNFTLISQPSIGFLNLNGNKLTYLSPNFIAQDFMEIFQISVSDGLSTRLLNVQFNYKQSNLVPIGENKTYEIFLGETLNIQLNAVDLNNDTLVYNIQGQSSQVSSFNPNTGQVSFTASAIGTDTFQYNISDQKETSEYYTITVKVIEAGGSGLLASYFDGMSFNNYLYSEIQETINFNWERNQVDQTNEEDYVSIQWEGEISFPEVGNYTFYLGGDDGVRLYIDNQLIIDQWNTQAYREFETSYNVQTPGKQKIRVEYYERTGEAEVTFFWSLENHFNKTVVDKKFLFPKKDDRSDLLFQISLNNQYILETQSNFPLLFDLSLMQNQTFWDNIQSDGKDLRVYDENMNKLAFELVNFNKNNRTGSLWFKGNINQLNNTYIVGITDSLNIINDDLEESSPHHYLKVWSDYSVVYHFDRSLGYNFNSAGGNINATFDTTFLSDSEHLMSNYLNIENSTEISLDLDYNNQEISLWSNDLSDNDDILKWDDYELRKRTNGRVRFEYDGDKADLSNYVEDNNQWNYTNISIVGEDLILHNNLLEDKDDADDLKIRGNLILFEDLKSGKVDEFRIKKSNSTKFRKSMEYLMINRQGTWWDLGTVISQEDFKNKGLDELDGSWSIVESNSSKINPGPDGFQFVDNNTANEVNIPAMIKSFESNNITKVSFKLNLERGDNEQWFVFRIKLGNNLSVQNINSPIELIWGSPNFGLSNYSGLGYKKADGSFEEISIIENSSAEISIIINSQESYYDLRLNDKTIKRISFDSSQEINTIMFSTEEVSSLVRKIELENLEIRKY